MTPTPLRTTMLTVRVEPELEQAVQQIAQGNNLDRSEALRALIRRGIKGIVEDEGKPVTAPSPTSRVVFEARHQLLVELLVDQISQRARLDRDGALAAAWHGQQSMAELVGKLNGPPVNVPHLDPAEA